MDAQILNEEVYNVGFGLIHKQYDMGKQVGKVLGHGGNTTCHHSIFNYIPDLDVGIVVMTNSQRAVGLSAMAGITVLVEYLKEKGIAIEEIRAEYEHVECDDEQFAGKYATAFGVMDIERNGKKELVTKVSKIPINIIKQRVSWAADMNRRTFRIVSRRLAVNITLLMNSLRI